MERWHNYTISQVASDWNWIIWYLIIVIALQRLVKAMLNAQERGYQEGFDIGWVRRGRLISKDSGSTSSDKPSTDQSPTSSSTPTTSLEQVEMFLSESPSES